MYINIYCAYISWNGFLPTLWSKSDPKIYLCVTNSKTWVCTHANFVLGTWTYSGLFVLGCTHM